MTELENFLRQTHADQGGEADFNTWLEYVAENEEEYAHEEAKQFMVQK